MYWHNGGTGGWGYLVVVANMLLFWGLVVVGVVLLVRYLGGNRPGGGPLHRGAAERILAERYARGEIDDEEYRRRVDVLRGGAAPQ